MTKMTVGPLWTRLESGASNITDFSDDEVDTLWRSQMAGLSSLNSPVRVGMIQTELMRRSANKSSASAERLAKRALWISVIATIGTLIQLGLALKSFFV